MKDAQKRGWEIPKSIQDAPALNTSLELFWNGFFDLVNDRHTGFSFGRIWWSTIDHYCERKGLSEEQTSDMHYHIGKMDEFYVKHVEKKSK